MSELRALWRTSMGSADNFRNSGQTQILAWEGTLFVTNGENDVFALDADSGEILWTHHGMPDGGSGNPLGWSNRGAALGDGRVFVGQIDARLKALDQRTGEVIWDVQAERWRDGFSITSAPLYFDGLVITGFSGGELGTRGRVKAFNAETGELVWTFYTVPAPGEFGSDTWLAGSDAWRFGGAPVWQTPAVDPELGLIGSGMTIASVAGLSLPIALPASATPRIVVAAAVADWSIDDMWTGLPRPSQPIAAAARTRAGRTARHAAAPPGSIEVLFD